MAGSRFARGFVRASFGWETALSVLFGDKIRVPRFVGAYYHRQFTVPLCLGVRGPGIAESRSVVSRV